MVTLFLVLVTSLSPLAVPLAALATTLLLATAFLLTRGLLGAAHALLDDLLKGNLHPISPSLWYRRGADLSALQLLSVEGDTKTAAQLGKIPGLYFNNDYFRKLLTAAETNEDANIILGALDVLNKYRDLVPVLCRITEASDNSVNNDRLNNPAWNTGSSRRNFIRGYNTFDPSTADFATQKRALGNLLQMAAACPSFDFDPAAVTYAVSLSNTAVGSIEISPPTTAPVEFQKLLTTIRRLLQATAIPVPV
jgi:hypothetical protein